MPQHWNTVRLDSTTETLKEDLEKLLLTSPREENLSEQSREQVKAAKTAAKTLAHHIGGKGAISFYASGHNNEEPGKGAEMDFIAINVTRRVPENY